jgi:hypothetical protein
VLFADSAVGHPEEFVGGIGVTEDKKAPPTSSAAELAKALAWPLLALVLLMGLWSPLRESAKEIPTLLRRSEGLTIAGVSLRVREDLSRRASLEVRTVVARLSPESLQYLLSSNGNGMFLIGGGTSQLPRELGELAGLGLIEELPAEELPPQADSGFQMTPLGEEATSFLLVVVSEFVEQLAQEKETHDVNE